MSGIGPYPAAQSSDHSFREAEAMVQFFGERTVFGAGMAAFSGASVLGSVDVDARWIDWTPGGSIRWPDAVARGIAAAEQGIRRAIVMFPHPLAVGSFAMAKGWQEYSIACRRLETKLTGFGHTMELIPQIEFEVCRQLFSNIETAYLVAGGLHRTTVRLRVGRQGQSGQNLRGLLPIIRQINRMNLVPVLIGVDESASLRRQLSAIARLRDEGARIALPVEGIFHRHDQPRAKFCQKVISAGQCDLIGGGSEIQSISETAGWLSRFGGTPRAHQIIQDNASAICDSRPQDVPAQQSPTWRLGRLLRGA